jgi:hypothetical protein
LLYYFDDHSVQFHLNSLVLLFLFALLDFMFMVMIAFSHLEFQL